MRKSMGKLEHSFGKDITSNNNIQEQMDHNNKENMLPLAISTAQVNKFKKKNKSKRTSIINNNNSIILDEDLNKTQEVEETSFAYQKIEEVSK
jgi:hypothetical protein